MLGLTSYQEALRALGPLVDRATHLRVTEHVEAGWLELTTERGTRRIEAGELENIVVDSLAKRGGGRIAGEMSDLLRSVGLALDELHALDVCLALSPDRLIVS